MDSFNSTFQIVDFFEIWTSRYELLQVMNFFKTWTSSNHGIHKTNLFKVRMSSYLGHSKHGPLQNKDFVKYNTGVKAERGRRCWSLFRRSFLHQRQWSCSDVGISVRTAGRRRTRLTQTATHNGACRAAALHGLPLPERWPHHNTLLRDNSTILRSNGRVSTTHYTPFHPQWCRDFQQNAPAWHRYHDKCDVVILSLFPFTDVEFHLS